MAGEQNAETLRRGFEAFQKGDMDALRNEFFTEDTIWHVAGKGPMAGDYRGQEVFEWFRKLFELSGGTFRVDVHDILGTADHAVAITTVSAEREGKKLENAKGIEVHHFEGGKVSESWLLNEDADEYEQFWS
ncbi:MAG TPA: nuclear transport factor 2 family protein [Actinomycetota bacterium]